MAFVISVAHIASAGVAPDADGDGIPDVLDRCLQDPRNATVSNSCDTDCDGYGNVCDADFNNNYAVTSADFGQFFSPAFKGSDPSPWPQGMDMNCSGAVTSADFGQFFSPKFKGNLGGAIPGPSGLSCAGTSGCGCSGCLTCQDCNGQACVNGACGGCTSDSQCCSPMQCLDGVCALF